MKQKIISNGKGEIDQQECVGEVVFFMVTLGKLLIAT